MKCPVPCSEVTLTSGAEVGDLSTKVPLGSHGACMVMGGYTGWGGPKKALNGGGANWPIPSLKLTVRSEN